MIAIAPRRFRTARQHHLQHRAIAGAERRVLGPGRRGDGEAGGVDHHIHVVAWQGEARHTAHIVDAYRHGPLARSDDGCQSALGADRRQLAFEHGLAAVAMVLAVVLLIIVAAEPAVMIFVIMLSYVLSGPIGLLLSWPRRRRLEKAIHKGHEELLQEHEPVLRGGDGS